MAAVTAGPVALVEARTFPAPAREALEEAEGLERSVVTVAPEARAE